jgi:chemotaxis protein MotB
VRPRKRDRHEEHENHDRWLVSYADFITLLFAFFVVMYAISQVNEGKYRVLSEALMEAFKPDGRSDEVQRVPAPPPAPRLPERGAADERMRVIAHELLQALEPLVKEGQVRVNESALGISVEISASTLFQVAEAQLEVDSARALGAVAQVLAGLPNNIQVQGHTDTAPISTPQFPSNWELSGARASSVVRLFIDHGVAPRRLVALGYADTMPVESNDTVPGRARNRRVTLMILSEPVATAAPGAETLPAPAAAAQDAAGSHGEGSSVRPN